ncbi:hypothetical protein [Mesorhizobium sp.]|uniref:hypothetical protein n=1 Tax=Mesorhizobium sp. TaxID=1871066 RepID=UPI000FE893E9|nr:hypothetical protein [Mesorhizobium sp.]RWM10420.1 MAG: hypothetical protein EOR71_06580 [Mesorhizobium sp.]
MMDFLQHNLFLILAFGFGLAGSVIRTFGPLSGMNILSPIEEKNRAPLGLAAMFVFLAIGCMAIHMYTVGRPT